ncbi:unnamed protein product [Thelazia callipaeda]|uniref:Galactosylgalactosylxylosylprotein 3-beta-glucuronosyltransferase n=1 Tax=Thelazia callipaeda TaxID=103827 RepID=A0A158RBK5_THECL|nr:unnamed protein product [Thelazia callipaeda]
MNTILVLNFMEYLKTKSDDQVNRTIIVITPTYLRLARLADMTRLSQTLMHIKHLIWIVIEDSVHVSIQVKQLLDRTGLHCFYFAAKRRIGFPRRGWTGREAALQFVRKHFAWLGKNAVVYFADDDNSYDIRLFNEYIRNVDKVGVWAVGLVADNVVEAPKVMNKKVVGWQTRYAPKRLWGLDMAGFAINLQLFIDNPDAGWKKTCTDPSPEPCLLKQLKLSWSDLTPFGLENHSRDVLVWHTKTKSSAKNVDSYGYNVEVHVHILSY